MINQNTFNSMTYTLILVDYKKCLSKQKSKYWCTHGSWTLWNPIKSDTIRSGKFIFIVLIKNFSRIWGRNQWQVRNCIYILILGTRTIEQWGNFFCPSRRTSFLTSRMNLNRRCTDQLLNLRQEVYWLTIIIF